MGGNAHFLLAPLIDLSYAVFIGSKERKMGPQTQGIEVQELQSMETIESTGTFSMISFSLIAVEEIEFPSVLESDE